MPEAAATFSPFARRALVANSLLGSLQRVVANGPLLQLIAITQLALSDVQYGLVAGLLATASLAQLPGLASQYRFGIYTTLITTYRLRTALLLAMAVVALAASVGSPRGALLFFCCAYLVSCCHAAGFNVCWPAILRAGVGAEARGAVTSRLRSTQMAFAAAMVLALALAGPHALAGWPFAALLALFTLYSFVATRQVRWMRDGVPLPNMDAGEPIRRCVERDLMRLLGLPSFRRFLLLIALFGFCSFPVPIYFLRDVAGFGPQALFWYATALTWIGIASLRLWGTAIDRHGSWGAMRIAATGAMAGLALLLATVAGTQDIGGSLPLVQRALIVAGLLLVGTSAQGLALAWFNASLDVVPKESTTLGVLLLSLANDVAMASGVLLVGTLRVWWHGGRADLEQAILALWIACVATAWFLVRRWTPGNRGALLPTWRKAR